MIADYTIGGYWGNHIEWLVDDWSKVNFNEDTLEVAGHTPIRPEKGQTIMGEFNKSWIKFKFIEVRYCSEPNDMFFAKVKAIDQEMK